MSATVATETPREPADCRQSPKIWKKIARKFTRKFTFMREKIYMQDEHEKIFCFREYSRKRQRLPPARVDTALEKNELDTRKFLFASSIRYSRDAENCTEKN